LGTQEAGIGSFGATKQWEEERPQITTSQPPEVAQRDDRCPIPGNIRCQVGHGSEQAGLVEDVPAYCRGVGLDDL